MKDGTGGRRRRSKSERLAERHASKEAVQSKHYIAWCLGCNYTTRLFKARWSGQFLCWLCRRCYALSEDGSLDEDINREFSSGSSVHGMKGGLPTLGKRR